MVRKIVHLRWKQRPGPVEIGDRLKMPASTVHAVLVRCRINRLTHIDRATGEPILRYEHAKPGDLIHVDVKNSGRSPTAAAGAYVEAHHDETKETATEVRRNPVVWLAERGSGRGLGLEEVLQLRVSPTRSSASLGPRAQPPPAPLTIGKAAPITR